MKNFGAVQHAYFNTGAKSSCHQPTATASLEPAVRPSPEGCISSPPRTPGMLLLLLLIAMTLTACTKKVAVPNLSQMDVDQARAALLAQKLKLSIPGSPGTVPTGAYVVGQNPPFGQQVSENSTVNLTVEFPITVPEVVNSNLPDAINTLQGLGLKVTLVKQPSKNLFGQPKIAQQFPPANTLLRHDGTVTLIVNAPPNLGTLLSRVTQQPAYANLKPEYRTILDGFLK